MIDHSWTIVDDVHVVDSKDSSIQKWVSCFRIIRVSREHRYITMRCSEVDAILCEANIVCRIVETHRLMSVNAIMLE
jgi:hypothetical protein